MAKETICSRCGKSKAPHELRKKRNVCLTCEAAASRARRRGNLPEAPPPPPERLEVDLYVCPEPSCRLIGKRPISDAGGSIKGFCKGPLTAPHKRRKKDGTGALRGDKMKGRQDFRPGDPPKC